MSRDDALRKISLLSRITQENGASAPEAAVAARMAEELTRRYVEKEVEPRLSSAATKWWEVSTEP